MSDKILTKFTMAGSGGRAVAVNPKFVRCLVTSKASARSASYQSVEIELGDEQAPIEGEGDLETVALRLGFQLVDAAHATNNRTGAGIAPSGAHCSAIY